MIHVYPIDEEEDHELEGTMCKCEARIEFTDPDTGEAHAEALVIHNAFDFRHIIEQAEEIKNS